MGVIVRQAIKNNVIAYSGVIIGVFSMYIYSYNLALKGVMDTLLASARLLLPFFVLGGHNVIVKFLPYVAGAEKSAAIQLFNRALLVPLAVMTICGVLLFLGQPFLLNWGGSETSNFITYRWEIIAIAGGLSLASVTTTHLSNLKRIAIPVIFNSLLLKLVMPALIIASVAGYLSDKSILWLLAVSAWVIFVCLLVYAYTLEGISRKWKPLELVGKTNSDMYSLAMYSTLGSLGSVLAFQLDTLMVNYYVGDEETAIYTFAVFAALIMSIPYRAINNISAPYIARYFKEGKIAELENVFKSASQVLFAIGALIFVGAIVCLPYVYQLEPSMISFSLGYSATILLCFSQLFDQLTSINSVILGYSDSYRWTVVFTIIMAVMNVILNFLFLGVFDYGLIGAACATALTLSFYNIIKLIFIYVKIGIHPLTNSLLYTSLAVSLIGGIAWWLPLFSMGAYSQLFIRGGMIVGLFYLYVRYTNGVPPAKKVLTDGVKAIFG